MPVTSPLMASDKDEDTIAPVRGGQAATKKPKERTHGRRRTEYDTETVKKTKLITQRREKDLEERRARLDAAGSEGLRLRPLRKITSKTHPEAAQPVVKPTSASITEPITVKSLAAALAVKSLGRNH